MSEPSLRRRERPGTQCWRRPVTRKTVSLIPSTQKMYKQMLLCQISKANWCGKRNKMSIGSCNEHENSYYCQQIFEFNVILHFVKTCILRYCPQDSAGTSFGSWSVWQLSFLPPSNSLSGGFTCVSVLIANGYPGVWEIVFDYGFLFVQDWPRSILIINISPLRMVISCVLSQLLILYTC